MKQNRKKKSPLIALLVLLMATLPKVSCKVRVENSKFWPISQPVKIKESYWLEALKNLNISIGIRRECPKYMFRFRERDEDSYTCFSQFDNCSYLNNAQDKCIECKTGYFLASRPSGLHFCIEKKPWQRSLPWREVYTCASLLAVLYGIWLLWKTYQKNKMQEKQQQEKELQLELKFKGMKTMRQEYLINKISKRVRYIKEKNYTKMEEYRKMMNVSKPPLKMPDTPLPLLNSSSALNSGRSSQPLEALSKVKTRKKATAYFSETKHIKQKSQELKFRNADSIEFQVISSEHAETPNFAPSMNQRRFSYHNRANLNESLYSKKSLEPKKRKSPREMGDMRKISKDEQSFVVSFKNIPSIGELLNTNKLETEGMESGSILLERDKHSGRE